MMQYIKFRRRKFFKKIVVPFQNALYYTGPSNAGLYQRRS